MYFQNLFKYKFDKTGLNPANLIQNEPRVFATPAIMPFPLKHGTFFTKSVVVRDVGNTRVLEPGTDYIFNGLDSDLVASTGLQVAGAIELTDRNFIGNLEITYQAVGGPEGNVRALYLDLIEAIQQAGSNPSVVWEAIIGKPQRFPPELHNHALSGITEVEALTQALDDMTNAIVNSKPMTASTQNLVEHLEGILKVQAQMQNSINSVALNLGSADLWEQLRQQIEEYFSIPDVTVQTVGLVWKVVQEWTENAANTAKGTLSMVDADDAVQIDFDMAWTTAKDPVIQGYGEIGTGEDLIELKTMKAAGKVQLLVKTKLDATVKSKWQHVL